ncbi:MAG: EF-P beta-lysylation protein EpmB [Gammaproteobacteria bacterium]|nr:EF-P beta-lysylation protein EpmB [Gammaproteobacteria bacterium]
MIPRIPHPEHRPEWQSQLARAVKSTDELLRLLEIDPARLKIQPLANDFPLRVPHGFVRRMSRGDIHDPLLRQVLPVSEETLKIEGFCHDPLAEIAAMPSPGLLHKYRGRALLTVTGACAVHCRYCFRRHFPYSDANPAMEHLEQSIRYLGQHPDIGEIILSGGDPLSLTDNRLQALCEQLSALPQLHTLRIHTRLPVVLPERVDASLLDWIGTQRMKVVMVLHCNHANEIDTDVRAAMQQLTQAGVTLLNQSVLLRGVNDSAQALVQLSETLFTAGILPYYLHMLDRVQGAAHFAVSEARANELLARVRASLPGYLVPRLVQEIPGAHSKMPLP